MDEGLSLRDDAADPTGLDARGAAVSWRIVGALVAAFVLRGLVWLGSFLIIGPVTGVASFAVLSEPFGPYAPVVVEAVLTVPVVTFMIAVAVGLHRYPERWLGRALVFGWALAGQTIYYVVSLVVAALIWGGLADLAGWIAVVAALNIPLFLLACSIVRKATPRTPSG